MDSREVLVRALRDLQSEQGLSQKKFARFLGISRPMLTHIYAGTREPGLKALKAFMRRPQLKWPVIRYLSDGHTNGCEEEEEVVESRPDDQAR